LDATREASERKRREERKLRERTEEKRRRTRNGGETEEEKEKERKRKRKSWLKEGLSRGSRPSDERLVDPDTRPIVERSIMHVTPSSEFLIHALRLRESS